jgi:general secretion pathway protein C
LTDLAARVTQFFQLPPAQMWLKASATLPPWVAVVLVAAVAWQLARTVWLLYPAGEAPPPLAVPAVESSSPGANATVTRSWDINGDLFGEYNASEPATEVPDDDIPETSANLELRGVIPMAPPSEMESIAIIAEKGGDEKVFAVGDQVQRGLQLNAVYADRVVFRRGGRLEELRLPKMDESEGASTRAPPRRSTSPQTQASSLRDVISRGPTRLTDVIRPQPVFRDGKQKGYRVYPGRQRQMFTQLGLRPGDMIVQINGMALDDPARGMEVFRSLGDATQVSVTVERNGQPQVLTLDTSQLQNLGNAGDNRASPEE